MRRALVVPVVLAAAWLLATGSAVAQVAAPNLNPGALLTSTANPAVLQWSGPPRVSVGYVDGYNRTFDPAGALLNEVTLSGPFFQARAIGENFSAGIEQLRLSFTNVPGGGDYVQTQAALAAGLGEAFVVGIGQDAIDDETGLAPVDDDLVIAGAAVRIRGRFYAGLASGTDTHQEQPYLEASRSVKRYGVAYHSRTKTDGFHAEIFRETRDARTKVDPIAPATVVEDEQQMDTAVVELVVSEFYMGLALRDLEVTNGTVPGSSFDEQRRIFSLGWVPAQGLAIIARTETRERSFIAGNTQERLRNRVTVVWSF